VEVTLEAVELGYGEEISVTTTLLQELFDAEDVSKTGVLTRQQFRKCLEQKPQRLSPQETRMLMQRIEEDEYGNVRYEQFSMQLSYLRRDVLFNALVESDVESLHKQVVAMLRKHGVNETLVMKVWDLRSALLENEQLCLSRFQVHILLSILQTDYYGDVDVRHFIQVICTAIPYFFNASIFMEKATAIAKERADAQAKAELEELQAGLGGLSGAMLQRRTQEVDDDGDEGGETKTMDRETVEKSMIHVFQLEDQKKHHGILELSDFLRIVRDPGHFSQFQLSESETRGFIAEAVTKDGMVDCPEHVRTWVPILFELRKSKTFDREQFETQKLVDFDELDERFPLLTDEQMASRRGSTMSAKKVSGAVRAAQRLSKRFSGVPGDVVGVVGEKQPNSKDALGSAGVDRSSKEKGDNRRGSTTRRRGSAVPETTHVQRRSNRAPSGVSAAEGGHSPGITDAGSGKQEYGKLPASAGSQEGARSRLPSTPSQPQEGLSALPPSRGSAQLSAKIQDSGGVPFSNTSK